MNATKIVQRGRPRSFDTGQAVATATRLFHARGFDAVGVAELVAALGIKPPSFYAAFGSKAGLFARALEHYSAGEANIVEIARRQGGSAVEIVERALLAAARRYPECDGVAGCLVLDSARNGVDAEARTLAADAKQAGFATLEAIIARDHPAKARELAVFVTIAMAGMSAAARDGADEAMLTGFAEAAVRAFRREAGQSG